MILVWLIVLLLAAGPAAWMLERRGSQWPRWIALGALAIDLVLALTLWTERETAVSLSNQGVWLADLRIPWIPRFGITFHLALDGLSLLLVLLTVFLGVTAVVASWTEIRERVGFFHFNLLWVLAGVLGVFLAMDLFAFFVFWEVMLVPMYFLISVWGHEHRMYAAVKFFIFTQAGSLLMLIAILGLTFIHAQQTGVVTFDYQQLLGTTMDQTVALWLMLGFFAAFAVKLPAVPLHAWLPDAHTEAPTGGSVILAGLLLKTGAYGLIRFAVPLFPDAAQAFAPVAMVLGMVGILYGAVLAFAQTDLKRLVAYSSISHLGFVLLGVFSWNAVALEGAVMQMLAHGITTGALFILAGALQERLGTRDMRRMGGLWTTVPRFGAITLVFSIASLGLPGSGNFLGEFLVLLGSYRANVLVTVLAALGLVAAVIYSLAIMQRIFHGPADESWTAPDLSTRYLFTLGAMIAVQVWLGLYPQPVLDTAGQALQNLRGFGETPALISRR
ncbi:MAG: NADH-ubiquinone oxidoreductase chain M [Nitrospira sp.]|jgi:NADH-quinone oxidoreductase subunit M|nr:NADH-ubiquinone oxidoreductase chain M [Nitrospira sp.]